MKDNIMIILTAVYVVATILISVFNARSSKATRDQIKESRNQFIEANRAFVNVSFEIIRDGMYVLKIMNTGNRIAKNVHIVVSDAFVEIIKNSNAKVHVQELNRSAFSIGIGQAWYVIIGTIPDFIVLRQKTLEIELNYSDTFSNYHEVVDIDISQYGWCLVYDSPINDIRGYMKSVSESVKKLT